jgi:hypothetical protein
MLERDSHIKFQQKILDRGLVKGPQRCTCRIIKVCNERQSREDCLEDKFSPKLVLQQEQ